MADFSEGLLRVNWIGTDFSYYVYWNCKDRQTDSQWSSQKCCEDAKIHLEGIKVRGVLGRFGPSFFRTDKGLSSQGSRRLNNFYLGLAISIFNVLPPTQTIGSPLPLILNLPNVFVDIIIASSPLHAYRIAGYFDGTNFRIKRKFKFSQSTAHVQ